MKLVLILSLTLSAANAVEKFGQFSEMEFGSNWNTKVYKTVELAGSKIVASAYCLGDETCTGFVQHSSLTYLLDLSLDQNSTMVLDDFGISKVFVNIGNLLNAT